MFPWALCEAYLNHVSLCSLACVFSLNPIFELLLGRGHTKVTCIFYVESMHRKDSSS